MTKKINVKITNKSQYDIPTYETAGAAGLDLHANINEQVLIKKDAVIAVPTGIYLSIPVGYEAQIRSRSGMTLKHGIVVANGIGTIDSDYRGEICVLLHNISSMDYSLIPGTRIAQMVFNEVIQANFEETDELDDTKRGSGGFGHTG